MDKTPPTIIRESGTARIIPEDRNCPANRTRNLAAGHNHGNPFRKVLRTSEQGDTQRLLWAPRDNMSFSQAEAATWVATLSHACYLEGIASRRWSGRIRRASSPRVVRRSREMR